MSIRFSTDSKRVKVLKSLHQDRTNNPEPLSRESIDFLLEYIETLETEVARSTDQTLGGSPTVTALADDPYYVARANAGIKKFS